MPEFRAGNAGFRKRDFIWGVRRAGRCSSDVEKLKARAGPAGKESSNIGVSGESCGGGQIRRQRFECRKRRVAGCNFETSCHGLLGLKSLG